MQRCASSARVTISAAEPSATPEQSYTPRPPAMSGALQIVSTLTSRVAVSDRTSDPSACLERLMDRVVRRPGHPTSPDQHHGEQPPARRQHAPDLAQHRAHLLRHGCLAVIAAHAAYGVAQLLHVILAARGVILAQAGLRLLRVDVLGGVAARVAALYAFGGLGRMHRASFS